MDHNHTDTKIVATFGISGVLTSLAVITVVAALSTFKWKRRNLEKAAAKIPGPPALPIIGNALEFWCKLEDLVSNFCGLIKQYGPSTRLWLGPFHLLVFISKPEYAQPTTPGQPLKEPEELAYGHEFLSCTKQ